MPNQSANVTTSRSEQIQNKLIGVWTDEVSHIRKNPFNVNIFGFRPLFGFLKQEGGSVHPCDGKASSGKNDRMSARPTAKG